MTLEELGLVEEYSDVANLSQDKWNKLVDHAAVQAELKDINEGLSKSSKLALCKDLVESPTLGFKCYLKGVMCSGKRLKFKLRSGTNALGAELKRWSGRDENGGCKCCDSGATEGGQRALGSDFRLEQGSHSRRHRGCCCQFRDQYGQAGAAYSGGGDQWVGVAAD